MASVTAALQGERFMTTGEVARYLGVSEKSVRVLSQDGRLPNIRSENGFRFYAHTDVERLAQQRAANPPRPGRPRKAVSVERSPSDK